jgi:hypothetical protein
LSGVAVELSTVDIFVKNCVTLIRYDVKAATSEWRS